MNARQGRRGAGAAGGGSQLAAWIVGLGLLAVSGWLFLTPHALASLYERDLPAYKSAIDTFAKGGDPYAVKGPHGLPFLGPPFVWWVYKLAAHSPIRPMFGTLLMVADAVSVVAIPTILSRLFLGAGAGRMVLGAGFFFAAFLGAGVFTALVVNNGTPLYALIAAGLIPAVARGRWWPFHLAVALATAFKPFYAAFWLVPLFADGEARRQWVAGAIAVAAAAASYLAPMLLAPKLMAEWVHTLAGQVVGADRLGDNVLGAVLSQPAAHHPPWNPYVAQAAFSGVLLVAALLLGRLARAQRIAALVMIAVFLDPRAMRYDFSTAAVPLLAVAAGALSPAEPGATEQALWAVILAGVTIAFSHYTPADGFLYAEVALATLLVTIAASHVIQGRSGAR
jgi:hypothetical protein